jgi:hypothetical protein
MHVIGPALLRFEVTCRFTEHLQSLITSSCNSIVQENKFIGSMSGLLVVDFENLSLSGANANAQVNT